MKTKHIYKNKAYSEVTTFKKAKKGFHPSDLIRLRVVAITDEGENGTDHYMHALEALDIINALSEAVAELVIREAPLSAKD